MGLQWVDTDATEAIEIIRKEGLSIPVRALSSLLMIFVLIPTLEFHSDGF